MEQLEISNPNQYTSKESENEMVSYQVTGPKALVDKYIKVKTAILAKVDKVLTFDEETKRPLWHCSLEKAMKVNTKGILQFSINDDNEEYDFVDTTLWKMQDARIQSCKDEATKVRLENRRDDKDDKFLEILAINKQARLAKYIAKNPKVVADANAIDDLG